MRRFLRPALAALLAVGSFAVPTPPAASAAGSFPFSGLVDLDVGLYGACAVYTSGSVACWGFGALGMFADGNTRSRSVPTVVAGVDDAVEVSVGASDVCVRLSTGGVTCWGGYSTERSNGAGQSWLPFEVPGVATATAITAGGDHMCALLAAGTVKCWGENKVGQTGVAASDTYQVPLTVAGLTNVVSIDAGGYHTCAVRSDATARCFGDNSYGQLGYGVEGTPSSVPTSPTGLGQVLDISAGFQHTCAIVQVSSSEVVRCWGSDGQRRLGGAVAGGSIVPQAAAASITDAVQVSAEAINTCVLRATGGVACWGSNFAGQYGNGTTSLVASPTPTAVSSISTAVEVRVGLATCVLLDTESVRCWGFNNFGAVGVGDPNSTPDSHVVPETLDIPIAEFAPIKPTRLLDTRPSGVTVDGESQQAGLVVANGVVEVRVRGRGGISATAPAVVVNITAVSPAATGFVTVWPCNEPKPLASNLNVVAGVTRANAVVAKVAASGPKIDKVCISPSVPMHLLADGAGFFTASGEYTSLTPARLLDTRANGVTVDGLFQADGHVTAGSTLELAVGGRGGVAAGAAAVVLNVTAVKAVANGYVTVWPCGQTKPLASTLNVAAGVTVANLAITAMGGNKVCLSPSVDMHLVVDTAGYLATTSVYRASVPFRVLDTRPSGQTVDGSLQGTGAMPAHAQVAVKVTDRNSDQLVAARTVVVNLTAVQPASSGYLSVAPCVSAVAADAVPASNLNVTAGVTAAATVVVELGRADSICVYSSVATHLVVDVQGWYAY